MEKRVLLALSLSFLILGFYPVILQKFYPQYNHTRQTSVAARAQADSKTIAATNPADDYSDADDVLFKNDKLRLVFSQKGGAIRQVSYLNYMDYEKKDFLSLISAKTSEQAPLSIGVLSPSVENTATPNRISIDGQSVLLDSQILNGSVTVHKKYVFRRSGYSADLSVTFENTSGKPLDFQYELFAGSRIPPRHTIDTQYIEANFFYSDDGKSKLRHVRETHPGRKVESQGSVNWVAVKDRHFSIILRPKQPETFTGLAEGLGKHGFSAGVVSPHVSLAPGASVTHEFLVYIGPNDLGELLPLGLEDIVNFGKMDFVGKIFIGGLEMLHKIFRNYGLAIIALTLLINLCLFPFTRQSFLSMKRMQLIQPQMTKLREKYKDNPQQLNKEMMELYKKNKVNPLGGCLPMLLQMPIFIALYVAISKFVRLIDAPFLWVRDLSSPDSVALPFTLPVLGNSIHVLPLIMCVGMALQQNITRMNMEGQDPAMAEQQKMMAVMMPIIFGFIFYAMPSALVLYWLTNTVFMTSYQLYLKKASVV